jgi:uncharacterized Ntn-hydrolase superfamily protein
MKNWILFSTFFLAIFANAQVYNSREPLAHTFSIVARDSVTGEMGVAVQSHWFSVGTTVSWAEAGVGAIATQSFVNKSFGIRGLNLLRNGLTAQQALDSLLATDEGREVRQVAIIDHLGNVATHTGSGCIIYAGHIKGNGFSVQSNMMLTNQVPGSMAAAFQGTKGRPLAERMLAALEAGQKAGGDIRGQQSAAILVVPGVSTGKPWEERPIDLRVEDSPTPIREIRRLYALQIAYLHMNNGDLAIERNDMAEAMNEYHAAMRQFPENLEMQYWSAVALANAHRLDEALPVFKKVFLNDPNWKELTRRLPKAKLLMVNEEEMKKIMDQYQ